MLSFEYLRYHLCVSIECEEDRHSLTLVISPFSPHHAMFTCQVELVNTSARTVLRVWNGVCPKEATRGTGSHRHWPTDSQVETDTRPRGSHMLPT